jgi:DNA-binding NarL/FixJ family response regulator
MRRSYNMNPIAEEILSYMRTDDDPESLTHYGMPRRSGRYPWGSGDDPYQHSQDFLGRVDEMRKAGFTYTDEKGKVWTGDTAIAKSMGLSSTQFRAEIGIATDTRRMYQVSRAQALKEKGLGNTAIGREMGVSESTVRSLLDPLAESRMKAAQNAADFIKKQIDERGMIDVGVGVERELNISSEKLEQALYLLEREGYPTYSGRIAQVTNAGQMTTLKVACPPGTKHKEIYEPSEINSLKEYITRDGGESFEKKFHYPQSMDSKRLMVRYKEDGGIDMDGTIELRRGVKDLSLGESRYSQVRILVDDSHYLKGMAIYGDDKDFPPGVDVIFNTNKSKGIPALGPKDNTVLKPIKKDDPDNPFGSLIKDSDKGGQYWYDPKTGKRVSANDPNAKLGLINKRSDEGDWSDWKDAVPSQFLSKQPVALAKKQLKLAQENKQAEFDEYCQLNNPTIKKHLLSKFADECDSAAVHLQAAALPGQKYHVIIPNNTLKETEVYAPGYPNGTKLALVRYPHGGTFEIPICTVNNKNMTGKRQIGTDPIDAICINSKVAERLSGADFDGDTVMCIPTNDRIRIKNRPPLAGLEGFDPKVEYGPNTYEKGSIPLMTKANTQKQMGVISNLITDMTLAGAKDSELAAAVRHSMVVIDAEKHKLNYKKSEIDNNIAALHKKYQGKETGGAATIISRAKGQQTVDKRQGSPRVNTKLLSNGKPNPDYDPRKPEGSLVYKTADDLYYPSRSYDKSTGIMTIKTNVPRQSVKYDMNNAKDRDYYEPVKRVSDDGKVTYTNKDGSITYKTMKRSQKSTKMAEAQDAYELVSPARNQMELVYADHANYMKNLARQARIEANNTGKIAYSAQAKNTYAKEVKDLEDKLNTALLNAPRERLAQIRANADIQAKTAANPGMEKKDVKKASQQALTKYRSEAGSVARSKRSIKITDREWEAIQAGAISENKLKKILANTDVDSLRQRATPRSYTTLNPAKVNRIKSMSASGKSLSEIAKALGVSTSTVSDYLKGES